MGKVTTYNTAAAKSSSGKACPAPVVFLCRTGLDCAPPAGSVGLGTAQIGEEQTDFVVAVRSKPVAWSFMAGLGGITIFVAGMVLII